MRSASTPALHTTRFTDFWRWPGFSEVSVFIFVSSLLWGCTSNNKPRALLQSRGSDTMVNLAQAWAETYRNVKPDLGISVTGGGSGTGIAALSHGTIDMANSSRKITDTEAAQIFAKTQKHAVGRVVALDALAVFVNPANPVSGLSFKELACIYGEDGTCTRWDQIRGTVVPGCRDNKIVRVSRQSNSGTYQYFRDAVVGKGHDFKLGSMDLNGSREGIDLVANTPCAIGYVGMGYIGPSVRAVCVQKDDNSPCVPPTAEEAAHRRYPISRELYIYTLGEPSGEVAEFLSWTNSPDGRAVIERTGYVPLPRDFAADNQPRNNPSFRNDSGSVSFRPVQASQ